MDTIPGTAFGLQAQYSLIILYRSTSQHMLGYFLDSV